MNDLILAIDLGTTGVKTGLFDARGRAVKADLEEYPVQYPQPGWVEQRPEDWWRAVCVSVSRLTEDAQPGHVAGISFSGQMMGCVALDRQANPLHPALIWADTRAGAQAQQLIDRVGFKRAYRLTGHRPSSSYSAAKIMWLREHAAEVFKRAFKFVQAKDFLAARMTGVFATDFSDASGTNLLDLEKLEWSAEMVAAAGLRRDQLPDLLKSSEVLGCLLPVPASQLGLLEGTPVVIGGGDGCCAAAGAGVVREGSAYNYIGSSSWIALASRHPVYDPEMRTFTWAHLVPGMYSPCGTMQAAGGSYQWLRDVFCLPEVEEASRRGVSAYELMNDLAAASPAGANGLFFFPYILGERSPRWDPDARGVYFGLTAAHTRGDVIRATLEGITLNLRVILDSLTAQGAQIDAMRVIGGGSERRSLAPNDGGYLWAPGTAARAAGRGHLVWRRAGRRHRPGDVSRVGVGGAAHAGGG